MADLEGLTRKLIEKNISKENIQSALIKEYLFYKNISNDTAKIMADAVIKEVENSSKEAKDPIVKEILKIPNSGVTMGEQGVGCRGWGDFFVHKLIADISETTKSPILSPKSLDDAGAVVFESYKKDKRIYIVTKSEGMHSRLSDFPFIAGFHVTRAALRDLYVKGARPISIMVDIHLADDADVGKLFDFMSGVSTVAELSGVPITAGSTLRIGGDLVIGTRITGGISAVGLAEYLLLRRNIKAGDSILMSEGAGGGTIATTAIFSGMHDVLKETMNIKFLTACEALFENDLLKDIHCCCDVTNGGLRGDLHEIAYEARVGVRIIEKKVQNLVNKKVLELLKHVNVDYLGVSLDALLIFCPPDKKDKICSVIKGVGVDIEEIGSVNNQDGKIILESSSGEEKLIPKFRESAYTKIKQVVGEEIDEGIKREYENQIQKALTDAMRKRENLINWIKSKR
ncbi:MAG: AIR synthase-related protein [Candidatus Helarchaeota archaeon]